MTVSLVFYSSANHYPDPGEMYQGVFDMQGAAEFIKAHPDTDRGLNEQIDVYVIGQDGGLQIALNRDEEGLWGRSGFGDLHLFVSAYLEA